MESKGFLKHFFIIGSGTMISMVLSLIVIPIITRIADPVEYGQLSIFTTYTGIAANVLCMGLDQSMVRDFYKYDDDAYRQTLLKKCIWLPTLVTTVGGIVITALSATGLIKFKFDMVIMGLLCLYILLTLVQRFSVLVVRLRYQSKLYSLINIVNKGVYLAMALVLLLSFKNHCFLVLVVAQVTSTTVALIIGVRAQKGIWRMDRCHDYDNEVKFKELFRYGWPFIISMAIGQIFCAADKMALNAYMTYYEVGVYTSALNIAAVFGVIQSAFNSLWAPMAVEHYEKDKEDRSFYQSGNVYITLAMFSIGIFLIMGKNVFALLLGSKYREAAYILPFLCFHPIMYTISETTVSGIVFMKKSKMQVVSVAVPCAVNIAGNMLLVPRLGCQGAAISTGVSYIVLFIMRTLLSNRYFPVDFGLKKFYTLTAVTVAYAAYNTFVHFNIWSVIFGFGCLGVMVILYYSRIREGLGIFLGILKKRKG